MPLASISLRFVDVSTAVKVSSKTTTTTTTTTTTVLFVQRLLFLWRLFGRTLRGSP